MFPRLGLPEWTVTFLIVLLIAGFPIAVALSWIFDITPAGIKKTEPTTSMPLERDVRPDTEASPKTLFRTSNIIIVLLAAAVIILAYPRVFQSEKDPFEQAYGDRKSIAVFPFSNHTGDSLYNFLEFGISEMLIQALSTSSNIRVLDNQTMVDMIDHLENIEKASIGPDLARKVASTVNVESYITGDFLLAGSTLRIQLKLIDTRTSEVEKSDFMEGTTDSIFSLVGSLTERIKSYLEMEVLGRGTEIAHARTVSTASPEAYRYYIKGLEKMWIKGKGNPYTDLREAVRIDTSFTEAYFFLSLIDTRGAFFTHAKENFFKADQGKERLSGNMRLWHEAIRASNINKNPYRSIDILREVAEQDPLSRMNWLWLGTTYYSVEQYNDALEACQQILKLNKKMGIWKHSDFYNTLSSVYMALEKYKEAEKILKKGEELFPESPLIKSKQAECALRQNDTITARKYIDQYGNFLEKHTNFPDPLITANIGNIYYRVQQYEKAEEFYRRALEARLKQGFEIDTIQPGNNLFWYYIVLGTSIIHREIDIEEGVAHLEKAREISQRIYPDHPYVLRNLGYAYHKQGKHREAYELLKQAELTSTEYNHNLHKYTKEVEAALATQ